MPSPLQDNGCALRKFRAHDAVRRRTPFRVCCLCTHPGKARPVLSECVAAASAVVSTLLVLRRVVLAFAARRSGRARIEFAAMLYLRLATGSLLVAAIDLRFILPSLRGFLLFDVRLCHGPLLFAATTART